MSPEDGTVPTPRMSCKYIKYPVPQTMGNVKLGNMNQSLSQTFHYLF
jgi:hypothetical protein